MTTFHELLGTDDNCSKAEIKKKYRQLSVKLHPDKGGSQALMQMLSMAYQQVSKGNGNKKCSDMMIINDHNDRELRHQAYDLKKKIALLIKERTQLQALIERHQQQVERAYNAGENHARQTLVLLQTTNNRLNEQLLLLQRQIDESKSNVSLSKKKFKKQYVVIFLVLVIATTLIGWFIWHYYSQHLQPQLLVSTSTPMAAQVKTVKVTQPIMIESIDVINNNIDKIMMMDTVGLWQQRYYEGTRQPYIAVRSINGSYIVKDCQGTFSYYSNRSYNTARVPANLIFSANDRQFSVYRIPYGNGSSDQQWLNSQSLSINNNIFSNNSYKSSSLALAVVCNNTVPF